MLAAKAAGMTCVITKSSYTHNEDFSVADAVFDCIGDTGDERFSLKNVEQMLDGAPVKA
jgi:beta-phosphoglucomutase-like phosphatase (HAD superfamily)